MPPTEGGNLLAMKSTVRFSCVGIILDYTSRLWSLLINSFKMKVVYMKEVRGFVGYLYRHPFVRYLFVGGSTFVLDIVMLYLLYESLSINLAVATSIAYWASITYNFILNRWWTFSASENKKLHEHAAAYLLLLGFNYIFTVVFVSLVSHYIYFGLTKVIAVAFQITWTYPIYKHVIFSNKSGAKPQPEKLKTEVNQ